MIHITEWDRPKSKSYISQTESKVILINHKVLNLKIPKEEIDKINSLFEFLNSRKLFNKELPTLIKYLDYFIEFYDDDKRLVPTYINLKYKIINGEMDDVDSLILELKKAFFKDNNFKEGIKRLVDDNYIIDVTRTHEREFTSRKDFTNEEAKMLLCASFMMKLSVPVVAHCVSTNKALSLEERHELICEVFTELFHKMCDDTHLEQILLKLYSYIGAKVETHSKNNELMWSNQGGIGGWTESTFLDELVHSHILYLNLFKLNFKDNIIAFIKKIVEEQLRYNVSEVKYKKGVSELTNSEYMFKSNIDKWEHFLVKLDESQIIASSDTIDYMLENYQGLFGKIDPEEVDYYMHHLKLDSKFHTDIVFAAFAKDFNGYRDLYNLNVIEYVKLVIILKRKLKDYGYTELPFIITSNIVGRRQSSMIKNEVFIKSIKESSIYKNLIEHKYKAMYSINGKDDKILELIKMILTHKFTYVEYGRPKLLGEPIKFDSRLVVDELLIFIDDL